MGFLREQERKEPTPLKEAEVNQILSRVRDNEDQAQKGGVIDIPFKEGELVKVIEGPFKEFDGTVQEINHDKLKLRVLVSIFGRKTPVEVDINQVEKMI
jgi:transcriptional antiterminator NusG